MDINRLIEAQVHHADLVAINKHFSEIGISDMSGILCLKNALFTLANVYDFERTIRATYRCHHELSFTFGQIKRHLEFAKYLRNKLVGHIHPDLVDKTVEWQPGLRYLALYLNDPKIMMVANLWLLETAINTYADANQNHKFFESETDLTYPPDYKRFINFLEISVRISIKYLNDLCAIWLSEIPPPHPEKFDQDLWIKAARTKFDFLTK